MIPPRWRRDRWERRATRALLALAFVVKLAITAINAHVYPPRGGYDQFWHTMRAKVAGLVAGKLDYDPPLYYLLNWPTLKRHPEVANDPDLLMGRIQWSNVGYLGVFYALWIWVVFPRILPNRRASAVASLLLLAMPGYQKLAAMVHCDNAFIAFTAATFAAWLAIERRVFPPDRRSPAERTARPGPRVGLGALLAFATLVGLTGLTRPFAVLPVGLFSLLALRAAWLVSRPSVPRFLARATAVTLLVGVLSTSWYVYRWKSSTVLLDAYNDSYVGQYQKFKKDFSFKRYFTTFYFKDLLDTPDRDLYKKDKGPQEKNRYANSFFTLAYSDFWADQWGYFSGSGREKLKTKRALLMGALPVTLLWIPAFVAGLARVLRRAARERRLSRPLTIAAGMALGGIALFLWWQTGPALLPGKNSSVKFIYIAYLVPFLVAIALSFRVGRRTYAGLMALGLVVFALDLPMALHRMPDRVPAKPAPPKKAPPKPAAKPAPAKPAPARPPPPKPAEPEPDLDER